MGHHTTRSVGWRFACFGTRPEFIVCLMLAVMTFAVYAQVANHEFVYYDDGMYITDNPHVRSGFSLKNVAWAFTTFHSANWHPLTWLSHMLDVELYGLDPGRHHLSNVLFHILNTLLLFLIFRRATGDLWPSAVVAALFALHPLHVESVAWAAERKDVLSTFFWMLAVWHYVRYAEQPGKFRYLKVLFFFILGLMAKPMVVTLPFVLLLLDVWPLERFRLSGLDETALHRLTGLFLEKIPLFFFAAVSSVVTYIAQASAGAMGSLEGFPVSARLANGLVAYAGYLKKMVWPSPLYLPYLHPGEPPVWQTAGAAFVLMGLTLLAVRAAKRYPYLIVGWLWYLGTLVPVIGIVQVGFHAMADRYTYVPLIGLFIPIAWGASDFMGRYLKKVGLAAVGLTVLVVLVTVTWNQIRHWSDGISLFQYVVSKDPTNYVAHNNLGFALAKAGRIDEAIGQYRKVLRINPSYKNAWDNLAMALQEKGRFNEAVEAYSAALRIEPYCKDTHYNLGNALVILGRTKEAIAHYRVALQVMADDSEVHNNLGIALMHQGDFNAAEAHFRKAIALNPDDPDARNNLGFLLLSQKRTEQAIAQFRSALKLDPKHPRALDNLRQAIAAHERVKGRIRNPMPVSKNRSKSNEP